MLSVVPSRKRRREDGEERRRAERDCSSRRFVSMAKVLLLRCGKKGWTRERRGRFEDGIDRRSRSTFTVQLPPTSVKRAVTVSASILAYLLRDTLSR